MHPAFKNSLQDQEAPSLTGNGGREVLLLPGAASSIREYSWPPELSL